MTESSERNEVGEENHIPVPAATDIEMQSGRSKRKRVPRKAADALNGCLCGVILNSSSNEVLECKQAGCETQWVSILYSDC